MDNSVENFKQAQNTLNGIGFFIAFCGFVCMFMGAILFIALLVYMSK